MLKFQFEKNYRNLKQNISLQNYSISFKICQRLIFFLFKISNFKGKQFIFKKQCLQNSMRSRTTKLYGWRVNLYMHICVWRRKRRGLGNSVSWYHTMLTICQRIQHYLVNNLRRLVPFCCERGTGIKNRESEIISKSPGLCLCVVCICECAYLYVCLFVWETFFWCGISSSHLPQ